MKFFKNKKAEDSADVGIIGHEANIEVMMVAMLIIISAAFIAYILSDLNSYHLYYGKDMSLLQDAMLLTPGDSYFRYESKGDKMSLLDYQFEPYYTTTISYTRRGIGKTSIEKSYVHFNNPLSSLNPSLYITKPTKLYFVKADEVMYISETQIRPDTVDKTIYADSLSFDVNEPFYLEYDSAEFVDTMLLERLNKELSAPKYFSSTTKDIDAFRKDEIPAGKSVYGVYLGLSAIDDKNKIIVYHPFGSDGNFGRTLYAELSNSYTGDSIEIIEIETNSYDETYSEFSNFVIIETSPTNQNFVFNEIRDVIETTSTNQHITFYDSNIYTIMKVAKVNSITAKRSLENANGDLEKALASFQEEDEGMEND